MSPWLAVSALLGLYLLVATLEQRNAVVEAPVAAQASERALALREELPPDALLHPLAGVPYVEQSYRRADGELVKVRRYTPAADLRK